MANRSSRSPGQLARFDMSAGISTDVPAYAVDTGQAAQALAAVAGNLSAQLGQMADRAKKREDTAAGLAYGQQMAAPYLAQRTASDAADNSAMVRAPGEIRKIISDAAARHGVDPGAMLKIAQIESSFNPGAKNPRSSAGGLFQFIDSTAASYGLKNRFDAAEASDAAARLAKDNGNHLRGVLGRDPSAGELYLAHQQGAGGAAKLLRNPGARAADVVGADAVRLNGGRADMTAGEFANLWISKVDGSGGHATAPLSKEPLALRRDGTIGGEAFDDAALSAFGWRFQEGVRTELFAAQMEHRDDPQAFAAAAADIRQRYEAELPSDPRLREMFDKDFAQNTRAYGMDIAARHEGNLRREQEASFAAGFGAMTVDIERQAQVLGANPEGDAIIGEQVATLQRSIDSAYQQGIITPAQAEEYKEQIAVTAARGRVQGVFEAQATPEEKQAFATGLLDEWAKGEGPLARLPRATVKGMSDVLFNEAQRLKSMETTASKAEQSAVKGLIKDDLASLETAGTGVTDLTEQKVRDTLGEDAAAAWGAAREQATKIFQATAGLEGESADGIEARVELLAPKAGMAGYADQAEVYAAAGKRAEAVLKERAKDPLGQAARAGLIELSPIDTLTADSMSQSLGQRSQQRQIVADAYGFLPPMFTPEESATLKAQMLSTDPAVQTTVMNQMDYLSGTDGMLAVKQAFGDDVVSRLQDWQGRLRYMSPDEMTGWLKDKADPRWRDQVKPLIDKAEKEARKDSFADIVNAFDDGLFSDPRGPVDADTKRMLMGDYAALVGERFAVVEDMGKAKEQAVERLRKVWGTSGAFGERGGRVMLYPPELHYPAVAGSRRYIADEVSTLATARGVQPENLSLVSDAKTEAAVDRGELPGYLVSITDPATGLDEIATDEKGRPLRHFFDPRAAQDAASADAAETRRTMNDPWLMLPGGNAIGPLYLFGAGKVELEQRARRIREIDSERGVRLDEKRRRRDALKRDGIPGEQ